jgi:hypothetical protein
VPATTSQVLRLRVPGAASAQVRRELGRADLRPAGMPPSAVLVVRSLTVPLPPPTVSGGAWSDGVVGALGPWVGRAVRPRAGMLPADPPAVLFADGAELVACFVAALLRGTAHARWWWAAPARDLGTAVGPVLAADVSLLPAVLDLLDRWGLAVAAVGRLAPREADDLHAAVRRTFELPLDGPQAGGPVQGGGVAVDGAPANDAAESGLARPAAREPAARLLATALLLRRNPGAARSTAPWDRPDARQPADRPGTAVPPANGPGTAAASPSPERAAASAGTRAAGASVEHAPLEPAIAADDPGTGFHEDGVRPVAENAVGPEPPGAAGAVPQQQSDDESGAAGRAPRAPAREPVTAYGEQRPGPAGTATPSSRPGPDADAEVLGADPAPDRLSETLATTDLLVEAASGADGEHTGLAGVFYLVNLLPRLPAPVLDALALGGWQQVEVLARALLGLADPPDDVSDDTRGDADPDAVTVARDPIWRVLALLDGRVPSPPPPFLDRVATDDVRATLAAELGPEVADPVAVLRVPGVVHHSRTHVDVVMPLHSVSVHARLAGLDRDPGWVPALGRVVAFHFVDALPSGAGGLG